MKPFHTLIRQIEEWRYRVPFLSASKPPPDRPATSKTPRLQIPGPVMLAIALVSLTSTVGHRFYNQPRLGEGTIAPKTIVAPKDIQFEDREATEAKRKDAEQGIVPVLKIDRDANQQIQQRLEAFLNDVETIRQIAEPFPFAPDYILPLDVQQFLRSSTDDEWRAAIAAVEQSPPQTLSEFSRAQTDPASRSPNSNVATAQAKLQEYKQIVNEAQIINLLKQIDLARQNYAKALSQLESTPNSKEELIYKKSLLKLPDEAWESTREGVEQAAARILAQGIYQGLPNELKKEAIGRQLLQEVDDTQIEILTDLLMEVVQPNLVQDKERTIQQAKEAVNRVEPVILTASQGEVIVEEGKEITSEDFAILDELNLSDREINWPGLLGSLGLVAGSISVFWVVRRRLNLRLRCRDRILLCLLSVSTPLLVVFKVPYLNLPAVGLLASSFYGPALAATQVVLLTGLSIFSAIGSEGSLLVGWDYLIPSAVGGLLAAAMAGRMRSREELALLGGIVAIAQGGANLIVTLIISRTPEAIWAIALPSAGFLGLSGMAWCVVALGISPYLEKFFDLITPIRLSELSNPNRPLLKRLAMEAPGTFQHTLFVSSLAEAAARELHCNVELVRAGTLYHDIGKMHDPLGFIENQMGGPNKHDRINDPWKSAEIIKKHVSEGLVMARKYNLPKAIRDFIPEHQGTILISYFYFQAKQKVQNEDSDAISEAVFRYDGPIPQSRETGLVMLADACEAALRSLKDVTPEVALATVKKIFKARWQDNQLVDSGLRKEELPTIAKVFVRVWQQYNHQRIVYPKAALEPQPSLK